MKKIFDSVEKVNRHIFIFSWAGLCFDGKRHVLVQKARGNGNTNGPSRISGAGFLA